MNGPYYDRHGVTVHAGDCLDVLRDIPDASVHAVICDPPYGLADIRPAQIVTALTAWANGDREHVPNGRGFMGRDWDAFVPPPAVWDECLRVLTPGGHLAAFAGSRTYDLMGLSIRMAGFEIRDGLQWLYGSGMPKGQNVGKAIDATILHGGANSRRIRQVGEEREVVGPKVYVGGGPASARHKSRSASNNGVMGETVAANAALDNVTAPATPEAAQWDGWNTSLKPAHEPIVLARKPLSGTVAATVLAHGTGALHVDACRVASTEALSRRNGARAAGDSMGGGDWQSGTFGTGDAAGGRWPANVLLDEGAAAELDEQSGDASRFFPTFRYQAKAPASERPKVDGVAHSTVKPLGIMSWLVRLLAAPSVSTTVCSACGEDVHGMRADVPAKTAAAGVVRADLQTEAGWATPQTSEGSALLGVRVGDRGEGPTPVLFEGLQRDGAADTEAAVPNLRHGVSSEEHSTEVLLEDVRGSGDGAATEGVRAVRGGVPAEVQKEPLLLSGVRGESLGDREAQGPAPVGSRLRDRVHAGASDGDEDRLHPAASPSDGGASGTAARPGRGCAPQERDQDGQPSGESGSALEGSSRPHSEASTQADRLPSLRGEDRGFGSCAACGGALVEATRPAVILDPFVGSGTTLQAARAEGFHAIGIEREPTYLPLIKARLDARPRAASGTQTATDNEPMDLLDLLTEDGAA